MAQPVPLGRVVTLHAARAPTAFFDPDGVAHVLGGRHGPRLRRAGEPDLRLEQVFEVGGRSYRLVATHAATDAQAILAGHPLHPAREEGPDGLASLVDRVRCSLIGAIA